MSIESNFVFSERKTYFNKFSVAVANDQPIGSYMQRTSLSDHSVYSIENDHPTLNNVQRTSGVHVITKGTVINEYNWNTGITLDDLEAFKNYLETNSQGGTAEFTITNNSFQYKYFKDSIITPWQDWQFKYGLKAEFSKMISASDDFSFFCITHINDDVDDWTREHGDVAGNESFTITRQIGRTR